MVTWDRVLAEPVNFKVVVTEPEGIVWVEVNVGVELPPPEGAAWVVVLNVSDTPLNTLIDWIAPDYQRKGYEYCYGSTHKTSFGERRINWYANPTLVTLTKVFHLLPLKHYHIIPSFEKKIRT